MPNIGIHELKNYTSEIIWTVRLNDRANLAFRNVTAPLTFDPGVVRVLSDDARALGELSGLGRNQQFLAPAIIRILP